MSKLYPEYFNFLTITEQFLIRHKKEIIYKPNET